jgi:hypothetical protein
MAMISHATKTCARCGSQLAAGATTCVQCGAEQAPAAGPVEVPPALAITVALGLLLGVLSLILLLTRSPARPHAERMPPQPHVEESHSPPPLTLHVRPSATSLRPVTRVSAPAALPGGPAPGKEPQSLGMPPAPVPQIGPGTPSAGGSGVSTGPRYPPLWQQAP